MSDAGALVAILAAVVVALAMLSLAALKGWDGWLRAAPARAQPEGPRRAT